ncbi:thiamine ABC transporter ATP-binding protein [Amylibacter sp.]|nr:thiamine ABC transporter ATP-binding protein [Amylibacter sp.]MDA9074418.1 thiamine ABC transporter ATP-binding protein [Amylibacter sp.]MDA9229795.1 thiamine ABC transporter ATP-binding protein [Amylibacter sp.]MDA9290644.1 thiamine ABC transporter ATP-binding protein [Amylibacter sp.]MDA9329994.1 thiamine ABC transporter ATP-binding protein [Amylibacter sp.]
MKLDNVKISHGKFSLQADFEIEKGKKIALLGPSGGGKSTLLSAIAGFKTPDSGRIFFENTDITSTPPAKRPIALLFQNHNLFPHLSVRNNIALGITTTLKLSLKEIETIDKALLRVGLDGLGNKMPSELSGGQQQRVALARCLIRKQPILCLDEPFAALGPALKKEMLDLVQEIAETTNATLLMVTHQPDDASYITDQTILIADGKAHRPITTNKLFANPPAALAKYLGN